MIHLLHAALVLSVGLPVSAYAPEIAPSLVLEGSWEGALGEPPSAVAFQLSFARTDEGWSGTFSVPAEGLQGVPLQAVELAGDQVTAALSPQRFFRGRVMGDSITGELIFEDRDGHRDRIVLFREGSPGWEALQDDLEAWRAELAATPPPPLEPAERGPAWDRVDASARERLVEAAEASHSSALVVLRGGQLVGSWYSGGGPRRIEAMSVTKSVLNLAVGRLLALGRLESIDVPVHRFYPEWSDEPHARITVRHLLNHTSGLEAHVPANIYASGDFLGTALGSEVTDEPGEVIAYNNNATNLLAGVIGEAAGTRMDRFIAEELFAPLGITDFTWSLDDKGTPHGMAGLQILPADLARLGQLALQEGEWEGEQLIDPEWFARSFAPGSDLSNGVGLLWWIIRDEDRPVGVRADGYLGQYLVIYPEEELVGVRMLDGFPGFDQERDGFIEFQSLLRELAR